MTNTSDPKSMLTAPFIVTRMLGHLARLYQAQGRKENAEALQARIRREQEK